MENASAGQAASAPRLRVSVPPGGRAGGCSRPSRPKSLRVGEEASRGPHKPETPGAVPGPATEGKEVRPARQRSRGKRDSNGTETRDQIGGRLHRLTQE